MSQFSSESEDSLWTSAEAAIESAQLSAVEHLQLKLFLNHALQRSRAVRFILKQLSERNEESAEKILRSVKDDLVAIGQKFNRGDCISPHVDAALRERESNRCCVSGNDSRLQATFIVPPSIAKDEELLPGGRLRPLLEALTSPELIEKLFSFLQACNGGNENQLKNLWLMSPTVRSAFRGGHLLMNKFEYEGYDRQIWSIRKRIPDFFPGVSQQFYTLPETPDRDRFPLPEQFLLRIHSAVSDALHNLAIENEAFNGWGPVSKARTLGKFGIYFLRSFVMILPNSFRLSIYRLLLKALDYWSPQQHPLIKFLPFGLCLKTGSRVSQNEASALHLIEKHTSITAPRLIDFTTDRKTKHGFLLMTKVPGVPADKVFFRLTYEERRQLAIDVGKCIAQYRQIQNRHQQHPICNTLGGPVTDHRTDDQGECGPYTSKAGFLNDLTEGLEDIRTQPPLSYLYAKDHEIYFTHSDLHLSNLLLEGGRLSGIIDWEHAGFKPEFWEYTRIVWGYKSDTRLAQEFSLAFDKSYKDELEAERLLWRLKPVF
ncbi:hypothetical protein FQN50_000367 [Emmonsiellopsis sp. PD_5]|nr:hypothetical protein FQN50_000367 [Emmonsiellopsis sp. PD_5]